MDLLMPEEEHHLLVLSPTNFHKNKSSFHGIYSVISLCCCYGNSLPSLPKQHDVLIHQRVAVLSQVSEKLL